MKPREVLFDTNVVVAAFRSKRGASHELVRLISTAESRLTVTLALESDEVLKRALDEVLNSSGPYPSSNGDLPVSRAASRARPVTHSEVTT